MQKKINKIKVALAIFSALAVTITSINLMNSVYATIHDRMQEIGIRMALGASQWQIKQLLISETLLLTTLGILAGLLMGTALSSALLSHLNIVYYWHPVSQAFAFFADQLSQYFSMLAPFAKNQYNLSHSCHSK